MGVFHAVARTQHNRDRGLKDESQPARSMETCEHVIHKAAREEVKLTGSKKLRDRKRHGGEEHHNYDRREQ